MWGHGMVYDPTDGSFFRADFQHLQNLKEIIGAMVPLFHLLMTDSSDLPLLIQNLMHDNADSRQQARLALLLYDEAAITPLLDAFYAGVSEKHGIAILEALGEIGGFEALALFEEIVHFNDSPASWIQIAGGYLRRDRASRSDLE